jgi:hypothetical protein
MNVRRLTLALIVPALAVSGCDWVGEKEAVVRLAHTEGIYVDVGELDYQVQISRQLNETVEPDRGYLAGLPDYVSPLTEDEVWFLVSMRVQNQTKKPHESADDFEIEDTTGEVFKPVEIKAEDNPLAYESRIIEPGQVWPNADSLAGDSPTQGGALLFKIPYSSLGNRPLELKISAEGEEAIVDIDV